MPVGCWVLLLVTLAVGSPAWALGGNDELALELRSGEVVEGWYYSADSGVIVLSGDNRLWTVPVDQIVGVTRRGSPLTLEGLHAELAEVQAEIDDFRADPPPHPPPVVVGTLSFLWAGGGHAVLGEWDRFWLYSILEVVMVGTATVNIVTGGPSAVLIPLAGVDLLFRGASAGESVRISRARRKKLDYWGSDRSDLR